MKVEFRRDDGRRLKIGGWSTFIDGATDDLFPVKALRSSTFNYAGADGGQMVKQFYEPWTIKFSGYIHRAGGALADMQARQEFLSFFERGRYFTAVFTDCYGRQSQIREGWLSTAPQTTLRSKLERGQTWGVELTFGDPYLYEYAEDDDGNIIYAHSIDVPVYKQAVSSAGYIYTSAGYIYGAKGYASMGAVDATPSVYIDSIIPVQPVWTVTGLAVNPSLRNVSTNTQMTYNGTVARGQTLTVDTLNRTAFLGTANVTSNMTGSWVGLVSGVNRLRYIISSGTATKSTLSWNGVIG